MLTKSAFPAFLLAISILSVSPTRAIVEGEDVEKSAYPFIVSLIAKDADRGLEREHHLCGGALVSPTWVITSAECMFDSGRRPRPFDVFISFNEVVKDRIVSQRFVVHSSYNAETGANNLALIKLAREPDKALAAYSLPLGAKVENNTPAKIAGWGRVKEFASPFDLPILNPRKLQQLSVNIASPAQCDELHLEAALNELSHMLRRQRIAENDLNEIKRLLLQRKPVPRPAQTLCAQAQRKTDNPFKPTPGPCLDDSGNPLFIYPPWGVGSLVGVTSFGLSYFSNSQARCDGSRVPARYVNINDYREWIADVIAERGPVKKESK